MHYLKRIFMGIGLSGVLFGCAAGTGGTSNASNVVNIQTNNFTILARQYVTNTVHIAGGHYSTPYVVGTPNTEYILDGDIDADGKALSIQSSKVVINLNGHTITYNRSSPGEGIAVDAWNKSDIAITNGSIVQDPGYDAAMPKATLAAGITSSQTTITVSDPTGFTAGSTIIVKCTNGVYNDEAMILTSISGNTFTVTRAQMGTSAAAINAGAVVYQTKSEGDIYGTGNNPVRTPPFSVDRLQISGVTLNWGGRDVGGINVIATNSTFDHNTLNDLWGVGTTSDPHTLKNRYQGVDAVAGDKNSNDVTNNVYHDNTINNCRHRGLTMGKAGTAYNNTISTNSMATNANALSGGSGCRVYNNTITARGEHPIGMAFSSMGTPNALSNVEIYNNTIDVQTTRLGQEYGTSFSATTATTGNSAVGFVTKWGGGGVRFHDNTIVGHSNAAYLGQYSPTGQTALINAPTRGMQVGLLTGESSQYYNNTITVTDNDGTGIAYGLVVDGDGTGQGGDNSGAVFQNNTVTSNISNVALGDNYGPAPGWPLFIQNTFIQAGSYPSYRTITTGLGGYFVGTGKFVSNVYQNGASQVQSSLGVNWGNHATDNTNGVGWHSLLFGRVMSATVKDGLGNVLPNVQLTTHNQSTAGDVESMTASVGNGGPVSTGTQTVTNATNYQAITDANGNAQIIVYDYELTDINGSTLLSSAQQNTYSPHTIALYNLTTSQALFTTQPDSSSFAWDASANSGTFALNNAYGSVTINTNLATSTTTTPTVAVTSPASTSTISGTVAVTASASDSAGISRVDFYVNGALHASANAAPFNCSWNTTGNANGVYSLFAKAYDTLGNVGQSPNVSVTVSNTVADISSPTVSVTSPANSATVSGTVSITTSAADNVGVTKVEMYVNGVLLATDTAAPYSFSWDTTAYTNGTYTLYAKAYDAAGNVGQSSSVTVTVSNTVIASAVADTTPPTVAITAPANNSSITSLKKVTVTISATDNVGVTRTELYIDGRLSSTATSGSLLYNWNLLKVSAGQHTLTAKSYDAAGNAGVASITVYK